MRPALLAGLLWCLLLPAGARAQPAPDPWCRLDDPGTSEARRRAEHLSASQLAQMTCPDTPGAASLQDMVALVLPCGRRLMMRRVAIREEHLLDEQEVFLGQPYDTSETAPRDMITSGPHLAYVAGTIAAADGHQRFYYIGMYDVSDLQMQLFRAHLLDPGADGARCGEIETAARAVPGTRMTPATDLTWFDALAFADALTRYLVALDTALIRAGKPPVNLPWVDALPGYLRLPTEVEWEYAARGGLATAALQAERLPRVLRDGSPAPPSRVEDVATLTTAESAPEEDRQVHPMGRALPNVLGLFDVIGNAEQMTLDLFYPVRPDKRLAAMPGGFVARGGNALDTETSVGVTSRREVPFYRSDGAARSPTLGFRLVLSGPIFANKRGADGAEMTGNPDLDHAAQDAVQRLTTASGSGAEDRDAAQAKLAELQHASEQRTLDLAQLRQQIGDVQLELVRSNTAINERDRRIRRQLIENQIGLAMGYNNVYRRIEAAPEYLKILRRQLATGHDDDGHVLSPSQRQLRENVIARAEQNLARLRQTNQHNFEHYVNSMIALTREPAAAMADAVNAVSAAEDRRQDLDYQQALMVVRRHLREAQAAGGAVAAKRQADWRQDLELRLITQ